MISGEISQCSIALKDLQIGYHSRMKKDIAIYGPVYVDVRQAEMVGIIGRNGIGKSTLLRTIAGIQPQLRGEILLNGIANNKVTLKEMARMVSFVSTEPVHAQHIRVSELVAMGRFPYTGWLGRLEQSDKTAINQAVTLTGISHLLSKPVHELSDGERQKTMIARALAQDTPIIILDEPSAFLDLPARYEILRILSELTRNKKKTILFSTHDLSLALDLADKLWLMADDDIFQGAPEDLLISKVFRKLFLNSPAEFDIKTATFRFKRELKGTVMVRGEKMYRLLTKRAMERIGFQSVEDGTDIIVEIQEQDDKPMWHLSFKETCHVFNSLYALAVHMRTNHTK
jgi:iron complex transport system ATP-binding protein